MALNSTLFTGLSGLDVNQTRLNVVGNNIANSNTVAFKSSRALFAPQFYVTDSAGTPASATFGGQNPSQRGLGATVSAIQKNFTGGQLEPTGRKADLALDGDGFFVVDGASRGFTRDGSFTLNSNNVLTSQAGGFVMGYGVNASGAVQPGQLGQIRIPLGDATLAQATSRVEMTGNLSTGNGGASVLNSQTFTTVGGSAAPTSITLLTNLADTTASGTALFNVGDTLTVGGTRGGTAIAPSSLTIGAGTTLADLTSFYNTALGIDTGPTNQGFGIPDPGAGFKNGPANSNSVQLVITGNIGAANALTVTGGPFTLTDGTTGGTPPISSNPNGNAITTQIQGFDSIGNPIHINVTATLDSISPAGTAWRFTATSPENIGGPTDIIGTGTIQFDSSGKLVNSANTTVTLSRAGTGAVSPQVVNLDFSSLTGLVSDNSNLQYQGQDGFPIGTLYDYSIGADGTITGAFNNGLTQTLGQVAVATFRNNEGLEDNGGNLYSASAASGVAVVGAPGQLGAGAVRSGSLELSNVDLSTEFTNLIVASTGFSAASRVITTSDQLIQELLNVAR